MNEAVKFVVIILVIWWASSFFDNRNKYEGNTAEEWADEYYTLHNCVESRIYYYDDYSSEELADYVNQCL